MTNEKRNEEYENEKVSVVSTEAVDLNEQFLCEGSIESECKLTFSTEVKQNQNPQMNNPQLSCKRGMI
jgi:hypothetical protein